MKKSKIILSTIISLLLISLNYSVALADDIRIRFNEEYININPSPIIIDGRTLVPVRSISEMLGASVEWYEEAREVSIRMGSIRSSLIIDSNIAVVNGHNIRLDVPAKIINGSTFIPLRFVSENFGFEIDFIDGVILISERIEIARKPPNPIFARAVQEYFDGGVGVPYYWGVPSTQAFLVDIDGYGSQGVLAVRYEYHGEENAFIFRFARIFYIYDDILFYRDFDDNGFPTVVGILGNNRVVILGGDGGVVTYTLFGIENGLLVELFTIYTHMFKVFYHFPGGLWAEWENREEISEKEFIRVIDEYGLDTRRNRFEDDTKLMLNVFLLSKSELDDAIVSLGETIVTAMSFWEEWWEMRGRFSYINPYFLVPEHFPSSLYSKVSLSSGFESLNDIRIYLLQFYTERWLDSFPPYRIGPFIEYDGVLYMAVARAGLSRPNWSTASHILIEKEGNIAIVETTLYHGSWHRVHSGGDAYPFEMTHRFTLIDGKIDNIPGDGWILPSY